MKKIISLLLLLGIIISGCATTTETETVHVGNEHIKVTMNCDVTEEQKDYILQFIENDASAHYQNSNTPYKYPHN
jgi:uncharacterized protein YxeA